MTSDLRATLKFVTIGTNVTHRWLLSHQRTAAAVIKAGFTLRRALGTFGIFAAFLAKYSEAKNKNKKLMKR